MRRACTLLAIGLAASAGAARAQSLQELYEAARGYDATYQSARALAESAQYKAAQADALLRASANATASGTLTGVFDSPAGSNLNSRSTAVAVTGRQPLFNRANGATIDQAKKALESSRYDLESAEQDLIVRVAQAYFDVLGAQDTLATTRTNKAATAEQLASAKRNFEVGTATITDTREAQARFDLGTAQEVVADNDLRSKRIALDQLVGRANVAPKTLLVPVRLPTTVPTNADEWANNADSQHPAIQRAKLGLDIARLETSKARAGHLPTVDAVAALNNNYTKGSAATLPGTTTSASVGLQLSVPLYAGYSIQNRVKETLVLENKSMSDLEAARRFVLQTTRQAYFGVESGLAQVKALEAAESSSALALEATQLGYRVGVRVNLDVLNAQTQLFTTRRDLAKARYDVLLGGLKLRQAAGVLKPGDVMAVNQLLAK